MNKALDETQKKALHNLIGALHRKSRELAQGTTEKSSDDHLMIDPEFSNVFGIFGPRGAGKSTVLEHFFRRTTHEKKSSNPESSTEERDIEEQLRTLRKELWVLPPIDCSIIPQDVHPGSAVLVQSAMQFERFTRDLDESWAKLRDNLDKLVESHGRLSPAYRDLWMEVAGTPDDYLGHMSKATRKRFQLRQEVTELAKTLLNKMGRQAIVVLLDDFDLVPAEEVRRWQLSLLDELHQKQVLFVLTADFHRLQHLAWDPKVERDDKTGRALLHKLLPWNHRISLEPWKAQTRIAFVEEPGQLVDYVSFIETSSCYERLLRRLLPAWPRGLRNLQEKLRDLTNVEPSVSNEAEGDESRSAGVAPETTIRSQLPSQDFLALLATCREESLLARQLQDLELTEWSELLQFPSDPLSEEDWHDTVEAARQRCDARDVHLTPLLGLKPLSPQPEVSETGALRRRLNKSLYSEETARTKTKTQALAQAKVNLTVMDPYVRDPSWHDPLRHDDLWVAPLRDAKAREQPFWVELLLSLALASESEPSARPARRRLRFLGTWAPLTHRLQTCRFQVHTTFDEARAFFDEQELLLYDGGARTAPVRTLLFWMQWHVENAEEQRLLAEIGWPPLLEALREARDPMMPEELAALMIGFDSVTGEAPSAGSAETLGFLPSEPWAMVLLVDALHRCPWRLFSVQRGLHLSTHILLAGAFLAAAYLYALETACARVPEARESDPPELDLLLSMPRKRSADAWRSLREDELLTRLGAVFARGSEQEPEHLEAAVDRYPDNSLQRAALAYLASDAFQAVRALALAER